VDELNALAQSIERTVTGPVWHGAALRDLLADVSPTDAAAHPIDGAHSIWELVLHISAWVSVVAFRLHADSSPDPTDDEDWPSPPVRPTAAGWSRARARLSMVHDTLAESVRQLDPAELGRRVVGRQYSVRAMLHGIPEHGAYHGGQIALLTRALQNRLPS
jgi:uncharacterized damage-inducible protein DinB